LGLLAERYLRAVAGRNRFAHRYGCELAEQVLEVTAQAGEWMQVGDAWVNRVTGEVAVAPGTAAADMAGVRPSV
jgi:hypothetical protein